MIRLGRISYVNMAPVFYRVDADVDEIQLVSKKPLEQVRSVAVTPESATSVVLTKVLLPEATHLPSGEEADAKLLIGRASCRSAFEDPTPHYDLGRLWLERTGLPMV